jgi:hypothetical protein
MGGGRVTAETKGVRLGEAGENWGVSPLESAVNFQRSVKPFIICSYEELSGSETGRYYRGDAILNG